MAEPMATRYDKESKQHVLDLDDGDEFIPRTDLGQPKGPAKLDRKGLISPDQLGAGASPTSILTGGQTFIPIEDLAVPGEQGPQGIPGPPPVYRGHDPLAVPGLVALLQMTEEIVGQTAVPDVKGNHNGTAVDPIVPRGRPGAWQGGNIWVGQRIDLANSAALQTAIRDSSCAFAFPVQADVPGSSVKLFTLSGGGGNTLCELLVNTSGALEEFHQYGSGTNVRTQLGVMTPGTRTVVVFLLRQATTTIYTWVDGDELPFVAGLANPTGGSAATASITSSANIVRVATTDFAIMSGPAVTYEACAAYAKAYEKRVRGEAGQGGPGSAVLSVNGKPGPAVILSSADVGADLAGTAAGLMAGHLSGLDPHSQYFNTARGDARYVRIGGGGGGGTITSVNGQTGPTVILDASDVGALAADADATFGPSGKTLLIGSNPVFPSTLQAGIGATIDFSDAAIVHLPPGGTTGMTVAEVTGAAPLASPALTGNPTAPTQSAGNNSTRLATTAYADAAVAAAVTGLIELQGSINASANPNYPAALKGDSYLVSVAGKVGGASGKSVDVSDMVIAIADNAGGTEASVGTSWIVLEHNLVGALLSANNLSDLASASTARQNLGVNPDGSTLETVSGTTLRVKDAGVTLAKLADLAQATVLGKPAASGTGTPVALTGTQLAAIIGVVSGGACSLIGTANLTADATELSCTPVRALGNNLWMFAITVLNATGSAIVTDLMVNGDTTRTNYNHAVPTGANTRVNDPTIGNVAANSFQTVWGMMFKDADNGGSGTALKPRAFYVQNINAGSSIVGTLRVWQHNDVTDVSSISVRSTTATALKGAAFPPYTRICVWEFAVA